jgi:hypothetical protein
MSVFIETGNPTEISSTLGYLVSRHCFVVSWLQQVHPQSTFQQKCEEKHGKGEYKKKIESYFIIVQS